MAQITSTKQFYEGTYFFNEIGTGRTKWTKHLFAYEPEEGDELEKRTYYQIKFKMADKNRIEPILNQLTNFDGIRIKGNFKNYENEKGYTVNEVWVSDIQII